MEQVVESKNTIIYLNINGLHPKSNQSKIEYLENYAKLNNSIIMCISESHLCPEILDSEIHIKNWISHRSDRLNSEKGGVVIYTKENILTTNYFEF